MSGPAIELRADSARNIALVVHEMVTNAVKYGALSVPGGVISVNTQSDGDRVTFVWQERGVRPRLRRMPMALAAASSSVP